MSDEHEITNNDQGLGNNDQGTTSKEQGPSAQNLEHTENKDQLENVKRDFASHNEKAKKSFFSHKCKQCEESKKEAEEYKAGWMRAQADYKNLQREISEQRSQWAVMSELQILEEFIPVYDNFKKAFNTTDFGNTDHADIVKWENWKKGIGYIMQQFGTILKQHDIEEIKTVGEMFNPEFHEAMSEEESDQPEHTIVREVDPGYLMKGKVVKVAKVIVAKKKE